MPRVPKSVELSRRRLFKSTIWEGLQIPKGLSPNVGLARWNRKLHFYAGLLLLFFLWLFTFTGLLLNHPSWSFAESWNNRRETNFERRITAPGPEVKGDLAQAGD